MATFTHLHVASGFSAHHGTARPEILAAAAADMGAPAAALTDRDGLYGAIRHIRTCLEANIAPIAGAELLIAAGEESPTTVTVLAHGGDGGAGWAGVSRLVSAAHAPRRGARRAPHGTANRTAILEPSRPASFLFNEGGPVGTLLLGADSNVGRAVTAGDYDTARDRLEVWKARLPHAVVVEVVCHLTRPGTARSITHAARMLELAYAADVPAVLTNEVRYLTPDDAITGDVLDAAGRLQPLGTFVPQPNGQAWLKPAVMMHRLAFRIAEHSSLPKAAAEDMLTATEALADRCRLDPVDDLQWRKPKVPELSVLGIEGDPGRALWQKCFAGIPYRFPDARGVAADRIYDRLRFEMATIEQFGFETYFLTVADVSALMRRMRIRNQARGSGASSLALYLLRVSEVDPLEHDLVFERFLGHARSTLPDVDIDTESARRHDVYRAIFQRYGDHRVTLLSMQNRYRARGATRDAGLALGLAAEQIDLVAENIWRFEARDFRRVLEEKPELRPLADLVKQGGVMDLLVDLTERLDRLPRHISMHPCGVILGNENLMSLTPVQPSGLGLLMSQFDKDDIDDVGLIKLDVLGVRMQSTIAHTLTEIVRIDGPAAALEGGLPIDARYVKPDGFIELGQIPHDDEATFEAIRSTHTLGMFQIESPGQRELVGKMQPDRYADLIADISLFRPGPMKGNMVKPYLDVKHGWAAPDYLHPSFRPFLQDAYGAVIYHEHVLRILHATMGIDLATADELRRSMEKGVELIEHEFRTRTAANRDERGRRRFTDAQIEKIWTVLKGFGSYGFCKAHGAAFAQTTYESAWLKTHFPVEFFAGLFEHDPGMYPRRLLMAEARRMGIPILPLDVNASNDRYRVERDGFGVKGIRMSLRDVHGISQTETARILEHQPYASIDDFYTRATPSRPLIRRLAAVGALDELAQKTNPDAHRGAVIAHARALTARKSKPRHSDAHLELFVGDDIPAAPELTTHERVRHELDVLGTEMTAHAIETYRPFLDEIGVTRAADLLKLRNGSEVLVAGIRVATQTPPMRSGKRVVFISLDDGSGVADCTFFEDAQQQAGPILFGTKVLLVRGRTRRTGERGMSIQAEAGWDLRELWRERGSTKTGVPSARDS